MYDLLAIPIAVLCSVLGAVVLRYMDGTDPIEGKRYYRLPLRIFFKYLRLGAPLHTIHPHYPPYN